MNTWDVGALAGMLAVFGSVLILLALAFFFAWYADRKGANRDRRR